VSTTGGAFPAWSPDGRFLINRMLDDVNAPITLIQYWNPQ